jgi:tetratricopeptide (TPR) repeat protein
MRFTLLAALSITFPLLAQAETPAAKKPSVPQPAIKVKPAVAAPLPDAEQAIPGPIKALPSPTIVAFPHGIQMAVTAATELAQAHVNQGLNHLHGGWEFEATRHFAAALREDPECLLAHWGMVMSLLAPSPETGPSRDAATDRMLFLVDKGKGTELERGLCYALIKYIQDGPTGAANAFRKVAENFPNDLQAPIFAALFGRSGYDELGSATPEQEVAEQALLKLAEKNPDSTLPLNALLAIRAEAPDLSGSLALARKLCQLAPDYPPYFHLLGHYEWRCGEHGRAASAFGRASTYYQTWMKETKANVADCPEWIKTECYRIVAIASKGEFETAYAAARQIAATPFSKDRANSSGARLLMWEAKTLPARMLLNNSAPGSTAQAMDSLPKPADVKNFRETSLCYWWIDGLRLAIEAQRLIESGDLAAAKDVCTAIAHHGEEMMKTRAAANASGERSEWTRAFHALEVLASDLRGRIALAGPKAEIGSAYNWFSSAADRQHPSPMMLPPLLLTPMASRIGQYYLVIGKTSAAVEAYQRALQAFPNDIAALSGLKFAYEKAKQPAKAEETEVKIQQLRAQ